MIKNPAIAITVLFTVILLPFYNYKVCILAFSNVYNATFIAGVVELVDTLDLGSSAERRESSSLSFRTILQTNIIFKK